MPADSDSDDLDFAGALQAPGGAQPPQLRGDACARADTSCYGGRLQRSQAQHDALTKHMRACKTAKAASNRCRGLAEAIEDAVPQIGVNPGTMVAIGRLALAAGVNARPRKRRRQEPVGIPSLSTAMAQSFCAVASVSAIAKLWGVSRATISRNLSAMAMSMLVLQHSLLGVVAGVFEAFAVPGDGPGKPKCLHYSIDHHKFDEAQHHLVVRVRSAWTRFMRKRRHAPASSWQVLIHRRILR